MTDNAIANLESFSICGHARNLAGRIRSRHMRQRWSPCVFPSTHCDVQGLVHSGGSNFDSDFSRLKRRLRNILKIEDARTSEFVNDNCFHCCPHERPYNSFVQASIRRLNKPQNGVERVMSDMGKWRGDAVQYCSSTHSRHTS